MTILQQILEQLRPDNPVTKEELAWLIYGSTVRQRLNNISSHLAKLVGYGWILFRNPRLGIKVEPEQYPLIEEMKERGIIIPEKRTISPEEVERAIEDDKAKVNIICS